MARPRAEHSLTSEELSWFNLENYTLLASADLHQWGQILVDRTSLDQWRLVGDHHQAMARFEAIKVSPLTSLGFKRSPQRLHPTGQRTVKPITQGHLYSLVSALPEVDTLSSAASAEAVDDILRDKEPTFHRHAHLQIDLYGTNEQIKRDFDRWLSAWRGNIPALPRIKKDLVQATAKWARMRLIPYFDLQFFAAINDKNIPMKVLEQKLTLQRKDSMGINRMEEIDLKGLAKLKKSTFEFAYVDAFLNVLSSGRN